MKKSTKVLLIVSYICIGIAGLWIWNGINGNPVSKMVAKKKVEEYITGTYREDDLVVEDVYYNFKTGDYEAQVKSPSSIDTHFTISVHWNKVTFDSYELDVLSGWNTYERIDRAYMDMVDERFDASSFPLESDINFGTIPLLDDEVENDYDMPDYGVKLDDLELDKIYDMKELAQTKGQIIFYAEDEEISFDKASELLLIVKDSLDDAGIPFYAIDFVLRKPRNTDGSPNQDDTSIHTANFLYEAIYEDGLAVRIEENHEALMEYYDEQDAQMKENE